MTWRSIKDDPPPVDVIVDVWVKAKHRCDSGRWPDMRLLPDHHGGGWFGPRRLYPADKITHWMPLPDPPDAFVKGEDE